MRLVKPAKNYGASWKAALAEFEAEGNQGFWNVNGMPTDIDTYIQQSEDFAHGVNLPEGWVPCTTLWLIDNGEFVGHVNIRHDLSEHLRKEGGHIGYAVRPSARNRGYGSKILELALAKARQIGIKKALVTCDETNTASRKIIEKNNGKLEDRWTKDGVVKLRFWIEL